MLRATATGLHNRLGCATTLFTRRIQPLASTLYHRSTINTSAAMSAAPVPAGEEAAAAAAPPPAATVVFETFKTAVDPESYDSQLMAKKKLVEDRFVDYSPPPLEVFPSRPSHYRMRAEFTVWHQGDETFYIMFKKDPETGHTTRLRVESFPVGSELLNELMAGVMTAVRASPPLSRKLFQANFHTTLAGTSMVTLIYHRKLDDEWRAAAVQLREALAAVPGAAAPPHIIGRSRKQRMTLDEAEVVEELEVAGRGALRYIQVEGAFSQPNAGVCTAMLGWAVDVTSGSTSHDLLELYCGNGNFTTAVAPNFRRVVATEVSKSAVAAAKRNFEANAVDNVFVARMRSEEFVEAWHSGRKYERLKDVDLKAYNFKTLLVDPPRSGLDDDTTQLLLEFDRVVYISCNPETLQRDLGVVSDAFEIKRFAMFDQFPFTHHVECGLYLVKKEGWEKGGEGDRRVKQKNDEND